MNQSRQRCAAFRLLAGLQPLRISHQKRESFPPTQQLGYNLVTLMTRAPRVLLKAADDAELLLLSPMRRDGPLSVGPQSVMAEVGKPAGMTPALTGKDPSAYRQFRWSAKEGACSRSVGLVSVTVCRVEEVPWD